MLKTVQQAVALLPDVVWELKGKDIVVKSANRDQTKKDLESILKKSKIQFKSVFKKSKSSSIEVLETQGVDVIFKPNRAKGSGGRDFEAQLLDDLNNYFNGVNVDKLQHKDVIAPLVKTMKYPQSKTYLAVGEGSKNQKRAVTFSAGQLKISNNTGATLSDVTIEKNGKPLDYLSLKMSSSFYVLSAAVDQYFASASTKKSINEFFGFDGSLMGGFGKQYVVKTERLQPAKVKRNLEAVLAQSYGTGVVVIHKKSAGDVLVKKIGANNTAVITTPITPAIYTYPEPGVRKYANVKMEALINGVKHKVNFQFRGTTAADVGPKYLRILLERV